MILGGESRWWIIGEDDLGIVDDCDGGGFFWYLSLTKLITTFWFDEEDERVLAVWELRSSSSRRTLEFVIVYDKISVIFFFFINK